MTSKNRSYWIGGALVLVLSFLIAAVIPFLPPGISAPTPVGPYFNGVFPSSTPGTGSGSGNWEVVLAYPILTFADPVGMVQLPDQSGFYVAGKPGIIWKISNDSTTNVKDTVLDITSVVHTDGDAGLINMILHPEFGQGGSANSGYVYVIYRYHPLGDLIGNCGAEAYTRLSRFNKPNGQDDFDPASELVLIQQYDPHCWHTGGGMFFDNEGYLYFTFGDAGGSNDAFNTSQQIDSTLFGGLHRIDVDQDTSRSHSIRRQPVDPPHGLGESSYTQGYLIPDDNPWLDQQGGLLEEFYAHGLRSPHRASYDQVTGQIWVTDVGESSREEINLVVKGDNLEWAFKEGSEDGPNPTPATIIGTSKGPIYEYDHSIGTAIIGGFVYRANKYNGVLDGRFIFGDHGTRNVWSFNPNTQEVDFLATVPFGGVGAKNGISSFSTDAEGNIYILKLFGTDLDGGLIYKLLPTVAIPDPPQFLSQTGIFSDMSSLEPGPGLVPYDVNTPFWSDGARKKRWIAVPNDGVHDSPSEQIIFSDSMPWQFPEGTVFVKQFDLPTDENNPTITVRLETRIIVVKEGGGVYGVTYKWNSSGTDAELLTTSDTMTFQITREGGSIENQLWQFPSRTDCQTCHNTFAGYVLGAKTWQLNKDFTYPSMIADNQLNTWHFLGMFSNPFNVADIPTFPKTVAMEDTTVNLETRVRSYLEVNCAYCHQPNGVGGVFDARYSTPLPKQNLIYREGTSVNTPPGSLMVKPWEPQNSHILLRANQMGSLAMPPLSRNLIDTFAIEVLTEWINSLDDSTCYTFYLSDLPFAEPPINGWGPVELDRSNGTSQPGDGETITINGMTFSKGLGSHAPAEFVYDLNSQYDTFSTYIGVDDETCTQASIQFEVHLDGQMVYQSPLMDQSDDAILVELDVSSVNELRLFVTDGGNGITCDHADWANAKLITVCDDGDPCTENDKYGIGCACAGTLIDDNKDGVCDSFNFDVSVQVFLEGPFLNPYQGEESLMRDDLRSMGLLPYTSPYPDSSSIDSNLLSISGSDAIVDWIWLELRDSLDNSLIVDSLPALLQRDGDVVGLDGLSAPTFKIGKGHYYLAVKHRNHLAIMTASPLALGFTPVTLVDIASGAVPLEGQNTFTILSGFVALWSGDASPSGVIDASDRGETWNDRNLISYDPSDCNLDGITDAADRGITWNNRNLATGIAQ